MGDSSVMISQPAATLKSARKKAKGGELVPPKQYNFEYEDSFDEVRQERPPVYERQNKDESSKNNCSNTG